MPFPGPAEPYPGPTAQTRYQGRTIDVPDIPLGGQMVDRYQWQAPPVANSYAVFQPNQPRPPAGFPSYGGFPQAAGLPRQQLGEMGRPSGLQDIVNRLYG